jgi:hypothetical protein
MFFIAKQNILAKVSHTLLQDKVTFLKSYTRNIIRKNETSNRNEYMEYLTNIENIHIKTFRKRGGKCSTFKTD